jgi:hypothetical protein
LWKRSLNTGRADHMTLTPDGRSLFVSAMMDNRVYQIATATGEITGHVVTGIYPHDNKVSRDGKWLYNTSIGPIAGLPPKPGAAPLPETPGFPFQLTIADARTLEIRDRIQLRSRHPALAVHAGSDRHTRRSRTNTPQLPADDAIAEVRPSSDPLMKPSITAAD